MQTRVRWRRPRTHFIAFALQSFSSAPRARLPVDCKNKAAFGVSD